MCSSNHKISKDNYSYTILKYFITKTRKRKEKIFHIFINIFQKSKAVNLICRLFLVFFNNLIISFYINV